MENQETTQDTEATAQPELTISDLQNLRAIVEVAVQRGAFRAAELSAVGATYDRLSVFLAAVVPAAPADDALATDALAA